ncbi:MAG: hypothetical protein ACLT0Y_07730 [Christensenellales bacterium]
MAARCPDPDEQAERYLQAVEALARHGFCQYEISNLPNRDFTAATTANTGWAISGSRTSRPQHDGRAALFLPGIWLVSGENPLSLICATTRRWPEELAL